MELTFNRIDKEFNLEDVSFEELFAGLKEGFVKTMDRLNGDDVSSLELNSSRCGRKLYFDGENTISKVLLVVGDKYNLIVSPFSVELLIYSHKIRMWEPYELMESLYSFMKNKFPNSNYDEVFEKYINKEDELKKLKQQGYIMEGMVEKMLKEARENAKDFDITKICPGQIFVILEEAIAKAIREVSAYDIKYRGQIELASFEYGVDMERDGKIYPKIDLKIDVKDYDFIHKNFFRLTLTPFKCKLGLWENSKWSLSGCDDKLTDCWKIVLKGLFENYNDEIDCGV